VSPQTKLAVILHCDVVGSTALVTIDERLAHERIKDAFKRLSEIISAYGGTTHELRGDALLAEFERASDAVTAALAFQHSNSAFNQNLEDDVQPDARIGIALGEVVIADSTLTGTGVVLAQRLEQLAGVASVVIQGAVKEAIPHRLPFEYEFLGEQSLKGFDEPVRAFAVKLIEGESLSAPEAPKTSVSEIGLADQSPVQYCSSPDGVSIAHTKVGEGYPLVAVGSWMTHLEEDWANPMWGHYLSNLAQDFTVIRYDQRGNGMSDWDNVDISFDRMVDDLKAVIDCYDYEKVALFGPSQAASVSIAYAQQYPEKVSHLILYGAYARGRCKRGSPEGIEESKALVTLIRQSWGRDNPVVRQMITSLFMPDATQEEASWFNEFQKTCGPGENIARFREMFDDIDISHLLANVRVPTLVVHCVGDSVAPLSEGKLFASRIPGAEFVTLNSRSHMVFENDPEFPRLLHSVRDFLNTES
jgi:class 3 adenylate cyclase/pimeloyl-ACP methyl ester carboxylesterase